MLSKSMLAAIVAVVLSSAVPVQAGPPKTELSKKAATLEVGMERAVVVSELGKPTWVMLPGDKSDFAPQKGEAVLLIWNNSPCDPVEVIFDASMTVTGWSEGRALCKEKGEYEHNPKKGKFSCNEKKRAKFCR
jgi:hypothetical protein